MNSEIGTANNSHFSIGETVNAEGIFSIFSSNLDICKEIFEKSNDIYSEQLLEQLKSKKKFNFPINKHMEMFIIKNQKNIEKIIKY